MLVGISTMLAMKTDMEEFYISPEETGDFLKAAQNVARHYSVETTQKTLDWVAFIGVGAQVFGTRAVSVSIKLKAKKAGQSRGNPANPGATVHTLREVIRPDDTGIVDGAQ